MKTTKESVGYDPEENFLDTLSRLHRVHYRFSVKLQLKARFHWRSAEREVARRALSEEERRYRTAFAHDLARHIERSAGLDSGLQTKLMLEDIIEKFNNAKEYLEWLKESWKEQKDAERPHLWEAFAKEVGGVRVLEDLLATNFKIFPGIFSSINPQNGAGIRYLHLGTNNDSIEHIDDANDAPQLEGNAPVNPLAKFSPIVKKAICYREKLDMSREPFSAQDIGTLFDFSMKLEEVVSADNLLLAHNLNTLKQARALAKAYKHVETGRRAIIKAISIISACAGTAYLGVNPAAVGVLGVAAAFLTGTAAQFMSAISLSMKSAWYQFSFATFPKKFGTLAERNTEAMFEAAMGSTFFCYGFSRNLGVGQAEKDLFHSEIRALLGYDSADLLRSGQQEVMMRDAQRGVEFFERNMRLTNSLNRNHLPAPITNAL